MPTERLTLTAPDDLHVHFRDGEMMRLVAPATARQFARAIVMPNLKPPVTTTAQAVAYRERIVAAIPPGTSFEPLLTLYLTDQTAPEEIRRGKESGVVYAVKYYPAGATTNSDAGVTAIEKAFPALEAMQRLGLPLLVHGEVTSPEVDVFDRETVFVDTTLAAILAAFPALKIVLEHVTTAHAVEFVSASGPNIAATITPQHLRYNRNHIFQGGIRPHYYCLPVLKRERDRAALMRAATSGNPKFFLGTDSAPHARHTKETACGCAGIYNAEHALELYAEAFEAAGALSRLEGFASFHGADFYGLPRNRGKVTLARAPVRVADKVEAEGIELVPMEAGSELAWRFAGRE
ncbi:MAG: dihydroorotase [Proteobacteria bacterium]|nr:dihydroorotase [Gemmatimonadota bacterium]MDA0983712.1 dihydroorotase [Pseudomonadota bacterium]